MRHKGWVWDKHAMALYASGNVSVSASLSVTSVLCSDSSNGCSKMSLLVKTVPQIDMCYNYTTKFFLLPSCWSNVVMAVSSSVTVKMAPCQQQPISAAPVVLIYSKSKIMINKVHLSTHLSLFLSVQSDSLLKLVCTKSHPSSSSLLFTLR